MNAPERPTQAETKPVAVNARRKLIRGAFALPAVAAVHSASALAVSSSLRCLTNGATGSNAPAVTYPGDRVIYLSIALAVFRKPKDDNPNVFDYRFYVSGTDVFRAASRIAAGAGSTLAVDSSFITNGNYRRFRRNQNKIQGQIIELGAGGTVPGGYVLVADLDASPAVPYDRRPSAALIFDSSGKTIVGMGIVQSPDTYAATQSCWTSFGTV